MSALIKQFRINVNAHPQRTALIIPSVGKPPRVVLYGELSSLVDQYAAMLTGNIAAPSIIPILMGKTADAVAAMLGVLSVGSAFASLNRKLKPPQLNRIIEQAGPPFGLIDAPSLAAIERASQATDPIRQLRWHVGDDLKLPIHSGAPTAFSPLPVLRERVRVRVLSDTYPHKPSPGPSPGVRGEREADCASETVGCCLFTSGSTGAPKGVLISEKDLFARATAEVECYQLTHDDVLLCILPFSFDVGLNQLLSAMVAGCAIVLSESWLPADIVRLVAQFNMTGISGVPAIWNDLLNTGMRFDTSAEHRSLRYVTVSGGDLPPARLEALRVAVGSAGIIKTYGQSETFRSAALLPEEFSAKPRSVGKPFAGARVYIVRANGTLAAPNEPGEIVHTGLGTMLGYLDADRENVNPDSNPRPNPFFSEIDRSRVAIFTGDTGWLDEEGFLYVQGREDAMLKVAGNRVYPKEIADQFATLDDIAEVEVIGRKDTLGETRIYAFVVPRNESSLDPADLRRRLIQRLPSFMVPQEIRIVPALPRTASGKPDRPALMAQL